MKTLESYFTRLNPRAVALLGILLALQLLIGRFTVGPNFLKIGFGFIIVAVIAHWFGPYWGVLTAIVQDLISTAINGHAFFFGFMISAILGALIYGISFYNREHISWVRTMVTVALVLLIVNTILNTLWVIMMGSITDPNAIMKMIEIRGLKQIMMFPIQVVLIHTILNNKSLGQLMQRVFN
jgi:ECF transporter S component (folate family)